MRPQNWLFTIPLRLRSLFRRAQADQELDNEMRDHLECKAEEYVAKGIAPEEARRRARLDLGGVEKVKEECRDARHVNWIQYLIQDVRYSLRILRKSPGFTSVAIVTLALGIGANTTMFSLVHAVLLRPLPFPNAKQIVLMHGRTDQVARTPISFPDFEDWRQQSQSFDGISAFAPQSINLTGQERPERLRGAFVSANFFDLLGVRAARGRTFLRGEDEPGSARPAVVNHSLWVRRFGSDPIFVGKRLVLNGSVFTVVGILPKDFDFPLDPDRNEIWLPWGENPWFSRSRDDYNLFAIAKLKTGVSVSRAQVEMTTIAKRLAQQYPDQDGQRTAVVWPLREVATEDLRTLLLVLVGAVALVLLIACANVVNLLLARGAARRKETSLRAALGASRTRLARQMLTETLVLWMGAGAVGLAIGAGALKLVLATSPLRLPPGSVAEIHAPVLLFTLLLTGVTALGAGLAPALRCSRSDVNQGLKEGRPAAGESVEAVQLRSTLVVAQVGLSLMLLGGAGLMMRTTANLMAVRPGFQPKNLLTLEYRVPQTDYSRPAQQWNFHQRVTENVRRIPGVLSASVAIGIPFTGNVGVEPIVLLDRAAPVPGQEPLAQDNYVDAHYFETMGIPVLEGRGILESDGMDAVRVVVINQTLARQLWKRGDALGRQLELLSGKKAATIVGVVGDVKQERIDEERQPQIYFAYAQEPMAFATLIVRTPSAPMGFVGAVRDAVWSVDRNQPMWKVRSMEQLMLWEVGDRRYLACLLTLYAGLATILAAVGIYGVLSYTVNRRTKEIGVRMALGAQRKDMLGMVIGQGMKSVGLGIIVGLVGAILLTRTLAGLLYGVSARDPMTLTTGVLALGIAGLLACWLPARRAMRVDPIVALRYE